MYPRRILAIVFLSGMATMAVEMAGARLLDPYFGNSLIVWSSLIGLIMVYLAAGYFLGGRIADRWPSLTLFYSLPLWASMAIGLIPFVSRPILQLAGRGLAHYEAGLLLGSLLAVMLLFSIPIILLGCISPFAIRLSMRELSQAGYTSGRVYALSTAGSIIGTFLPVLVLIPNLGTRATFVLISAILMFPSLLALLLQAGPQKLWYVLFPILLSGVIVWHGDRPIKESAHLLYEAESAYNYIQVLNEDGVISLKLNEGEGIHSVYDPRGTLTYATWDYFLVVPFFNPPPFEPANVRSLCMIGLAAGTIPKLYTKAYGPIPIDGAEIDPAIIEIGRRYFFMDEPNLRAYGEDGRRFLSRNEAIYDVIAVDAYRPPYIPFHLTTREFFEEARQRLSHYGVIAINVGRTADDDSLVRALAATMRQVFPSVYVINEPLYGYDLGNAIVVGTNLPTRMEFFAANLPFLKENPILREVAERTIPHITEANDQGIVFTDDKAPVEQVIHRLIFRYVFGRS